MMIHPEGYYEMFLKGKTQQEVQKEIRSIKSHINSLKKEIEDPQGNEMLMLPTPLTRLKMNREYLARAIQAYEEAGGVYVPTKAEQKSAEFDQALDSLSKLVFSIGGYFNGYETRTFTVREDKIMLEIESSFHKTVPGRNEYSYTKEEFIAALRNIHIGEWKRNYQPSEIIMDGTQWELKIDFSNGHKPLRIYGSNAYPYNFRDLTDLLGIREY
jgi:hypothetical protein